ncbi:membrane-bound PQQ-dependent dehydrogenase, glucose/quinate/shikimate family [Paraburkholderia sp. GAS199]|uniref:membrane-bound PQQ-dependent dehydrogenase, glucose/quinate/shikimate family n=1 Tax=Paraburkholderia sp. GAS199 TaxID=3035126 RepID=UPI003D247840
MVILGIVVALFGAAMAYGGAQLVSLGGSAYYLPAGLLMLVSGFLLCRRKLTGVWLYFAMLVISAIWALWEAGWNFWPLVGRLGVLGLIGMLVAASVRAIPEAAARPGVRKSGSAVAVLLLLCLIGAGFKAFQPVWLVAPHGTPTVATDYKPGDDHQSWTGFGRTPDGVRFAPFTQITKDNVKNLHVAWTFRTGDFAFGGGENQNTPLQIDKTIYACTPSNKIFALNAVTGEQRWTYDPNVNSGYSPTWQRCRSLAYADLSLPESHASQTIDTNSTCAKRIYVTTANMQLIALSAQTGKPCGDFGSDGRVSLAEHMGETVPGFYNPTSGPVFARGNLIVGGWVMDNQSTDEPSGVVRAFDAVTGKLSWAWDIGRPGQTQAPAAGESYTRSTPNMWATPTIDNQLGLVYLPTGNGTPDMFGAQRSAATDKHSSSIVALDATTGQERWVFQTTHHDLWDYDLPSKPVLYDAPDGKGGRVPALIQTSKRGEIYMIDRRNGQPIAAVEERKVPTDGAPGERVSPTQPYSVGMPEIREPVLTEQRMWGITPLDQLACRIQFRSLRYEGDFTPPSISWYIEHPSPFGTMNWGGISIDRKDDYLVVNDMRIMMKGKLIPRPQFNATLAASDKVGPGVGGVVPMAHTPYGLVRAMVMSPLGVPCTQPPFGTMTAIDMNTRQIAWQRSMGTVEQMGPLHIRTHLPIPLGMPTLGGPVATASGVVFFNGTADYYLRALDVATGDEIWKTPLPVGAQSTPLVYEQDGTEYVVVTAGGARDTPDRGDYIIAYALPKQ